MKLLLTVESSLPATMDGVEPDNLYEHVMLIKKIEAVYLKLLFTIDLNHTK